MTLTAAIKAVGGMEFRYALRGDPLPPTEIVDGARQRRALRFLLTALEPAFAQVGTAPGPWPG